MPWSALTARTVAWSNSTDTTSAEEWSSLTTSSGAWSSNSSIERAYRLVPIHPEVDADNGIDFYYRINDEEPEWYVFDNAPIAIVDTITSP